MTESQSPQRSNKPRRRFNGRALSWQAVGWLLILGGWMIPVLITALLPKRFESEALLKLGTSVYLCMIIPLGWWCRKIGQRFRAASAAELLGRDHRPPVIYLRSFNDDTKATRNPLWKDFRPWMALQSGNPWVSEEEQIAKVMNGIGPFIAVDRPGEKLPELGAARMQMNEAEWRDRVTELISRARLVVIRPAATSGIRWEIETAIRMPPPTKLVLLLDKDEDGYRRFHGEVSQYFPRGLPPHPGEDCVLSRGLGSLRALLYFEDDWTPRISLLSKGSYVTDSKPLVVALMYAIQPIMQRQIPNSVQATA